MCEFCIAQSIFSIIADNIAYLDPGSGSFILQLILAGLLGGLLILRNFWAKIKNGVRTLFSHQQEDGDDGSE